MSEPFYYGFIPIDSLSGVGSKVAAKLKRLGLFYVRDLWLHFPLRYENRSRITSIAGVSPGHKVLVHGRVVSLQPIDKPKSSVLIGLADSTGVVYLRFYRFSPVQQRLYSIGRNLTAYGEVRPGARGYELYHPELTLVADGRQPNVSYSLVPVYPTTEGLYQSLLRKLIKEALSYLSKSMAATDGFEKTYPENSYFTLNNDLTLADHIVKQPIQLADALRYLHNPPLDADLVKLTTQRHTMHLRVAFEELLAHSLSLYSLRYKHRQHAAPCLQFNNEISLLISRFIQHLSFQLTSSQEQVFQAISADMMQPKPMLRLLQGDVGSGKTVVAALAALQAIGNGYQVALMVPTEVLASQHRIQFEHWFSPIGISTALLLGKLTPKQKQQCYSGLENGSINLVIGTHALFQERVKFRQLGLVIIDEQHRFGVHQRLALTNRNAFDNSDTDHGHENHTELFALPLKPHQLIMTATPIPRTLAMTYYADLNISVINQLPKGRQPIKTSVIRQTKREGLIPKVAVYCASGQQVYWVCPLIKESETLQASSAISLHQELTKALPNLNIGLIYSTLPAEQKHEVMQAFKAGTIQILVATTVIEVGIDVPNANMMIIENAERLGLAQLHQLRGRIGRGTMPAYCVLLYQLPLSSLAKQRLAIIRQYNSGFAIAEFDLNIRGAGEILGTKQTGQINFYIADLNIHADLLSDAKKLASELIKTKNNKIKPILNFWLYNIEVYSHV